MSSSWRLTTPLAPKCRGIWQSCGYRLSTSVGAAFSEAGSKKGAKALSALIEEADAAMYQRKRARQAAGNVSTPPPAGRDA